MEKSVIVRNDNVSVCVNYYTELYGVISILTTNNDIIKNSGKERSNGKYRDEVLEYFKDYKDCKVCKMFEVLSKDYYFNYDAPVFLFLQLEDDSLNRKELCDKRRLIPAKLFNEIINEIKMFKTNSNFNDFYNTHLNDYKKAINNFICEIKKYEPIEFLKSIVKMETSKQYYINLMFGVTNANYGTYTKDKIYANIRPNSKSKYGDFPDFAYNPIYFTTLILHEFAHSFINKLVDKRKAIIDKIDISKYQTYLEEYDYGNNLDIYIDETIIRAIECIYVEKAFHDEYESYVQGYYNDGFICIKKVIDSIKLYITNINNYNTFDDYLDNIIKEFIV